MKNLVKKISTFMLIIFCCMSVCLTAFASEVKPVNEPEGKDCRLTFSVKDKTNGIFIDELKITLMDLNTNVEYNYIMTSADYLFGITVGGNVKQGNYNIALNYASKEQFTVQNADGTAINSFNADSEAHTFDWVVVSKSGGETTQKSTTEIKAGEYVAKTSNEEADKVWNTFLESVAILETDSKYETVMKFYETTKNNYARNYVKVCEGKTEDDYLKMTPFERFLWYSTYVTPVMTTTYGDYDSNFGSIGKWNSSVVGQAYHLLKNQRATEQAEAYKTLMEWQYNYFIANGSMYNFITGKSSIEENSKLEKVSPDSANGKDKDPSKEDIQSLLEETGISKEEIQSLIDEEKNSTKADKGIWSDTVTLIKGNAFTIVILLILVGATIGVIIYRKRKAIDDDK